MSTEHHIEIGGLHVEVVRRDIKNLHVGVYPPNGRVRVAAPLRLGDEAVRLALVARLGWINRQRRDFQAQERQSEREMTNGETHYVSGQRCRLRVIPHDGSSQLQLRGSRSLVMRVRPQLDAAQRLVVMERWYRARLRAAAGELLAHWMPVLKVELTVWGIKKMKTRWGTCNPDGRRLWLNLELAKKPPQCLEYIVVHELVHLLERHHNERFVALMDRWLPDWRLRREVLNRSPLAHEEWAY